jgi:hypothetical protein
MADVRTIADAARLYQRDVGEFPIWANTADYTTGTAANAIGGGSGTAPVDNASNYLTGVPASSLESYLNANTLGRSTTATLGRTVFKGPYIGNLDADPWGHKYYISAANLKTTSTNWGFVISAGPDGTFDTVLNQPRSGAFTTGDDDIVSVIR